MTELHEPTISLRTRIGSVWTELFFFLWVPLFKLAWLGTCVLKIAWPQTYVAANFALIRLLNRCVAGRSQHLKGIRAASKSLEDYWETYDASPDDFSLYGQALGNPEWFKNKTILDVGCGVGRKSYELAKNGATKVIGVDTSKRNIRAAQQKSQGLSNLEFRDVDAKDLNPEFRETFDYIISFTVFEHVTDVSGLLKDLYPLQKPGGQNVIVYNHYLDRYGAHLKEFIWHPWPYLIWPEKLLFSYWNEELRRAQAKGEMGYFPDQYQHGVDGHNNDCFMNLNKHTIQDVIKLIESTPYKLVQTFHYSESIILKMWPWLRQTSIGKYLQGSVVYVLERTL